MVCRAELTSSKEVSVCSSLAGHLPDRIKVPDRDIALTLSIKLEEDSSRLSEENQEFVTSSKII